MGELRNVNVGEALTLLADGAVMVDVREDNEWSAGRAPLAVHIRLHEVPDHLDDLEKDRSIICVCRSGARSSRATVFLLEQGFDVVNLEGGMLAWANEDGALVADSGEPTVI